MLCFQESDESQQITPSGSTSNVTDSDTDSDSEIDVTPRRELLITPPTGYAASPIQAPIANHISVTDIAPPPLPVSPPPTLLLSNHHEDSDEDSNNDTDNEVGNKDNADDSDEEVEVEMGVAELMDSCQSEMALLHSVSQVSPHRKLNASLNASLIVREDSALTVSSEDPGPLLKEDHSRTITPADLSREVTPCFDVGGDITPVYDEISVGHDQSYLDMTGNTQPESVMDSTYSGDLTLECRASGSNVEESESENEASVALDKTDEPTSDAILELGTGSFQNTPEELFLETTGTDMSDKGTLSSTASNVEEQADSVNSEDNVNITDVINRARDEIINIVDKDVCNFENEPSDTNDEEDLDDDDIKRLERKYLDQEREEEEEEEEEEDEHSFESEDEEDLAENEKDFSEVVEDIVKGLESSEITEQNHSVQESKGELNDEQHSNLDVNDGVQGGFDDVETTDCSLVEEPTDKKNKIDNDETDNKDEKDDVEEKNESEESERDELSEREDKPSLTINSTLQPGVSNIQGQCNSHILMYKPSYIFLKPC